MGRAPTLGLHLTLPRAGDGAETNTAPCQHSPGGTRLGLAAGGCKTGHILAAAAQNRCSEASPRLLRSGAGEEGLRGASCSHRGVRAFQEEQLGAVCQTRAQSIYFPADVFTRADACVQLRRAACGGGGE